MKKKRMNRFLAVLMALVLATGTNAGNCSVTNDVKAVAAEDSSEEKAFKLTMDDKGYLTADSSNADLENQKFSWDNATVYFVLTDRFMNGDTSNDHSYGRGMQADGKTPVEGLDTKTNPGTFHGGDLKGITSKVADGYFNDLGVNAIWITAPYEQIHGYTSGNKQSNNANTYPDPAKGGFPYYSYHGYWTLDYSNIDENMGSEADFEKFVDTCHEHGIRVIMDVVMNHVGYTTMQDAVDYGFDGALKGDWKEYYYGNATYLMGGDPECENYWDASSSAWAKWWGPGFVRANYPGYTAAGGGDITMSLCGLPDVQTESSAPEVPTPPLLVTKWKAEGRYDKEQGELDDYFSRTGNKKQARYYIIKWLTDWVREYGVDGFRCDTAKHVDLDAWNDLKTEAVSALKEWRENNPDKPGAKWTDDFWMTGEAWGHGMGRSPYYDNGFDSMINFTFPKGGAPSSMEGTYSSYAEAINSDPTFNSLSYISSHDDCLTRGDMISAGTDLLLTPGGAQIYYGDESNRPIGWNDWFTSDYKDQRYRTDMNWDSMDEKVLTHWQKVGQFRNKHISVGAGQHQKLEGDAYTFSRTYHLEEDDEDKVVCCLPGKAGTYDVPVGDVFEDGETVTDFYSGAKYEVSGGSVSAECDANGVILLEGSGIVKASVGAKSKTATYSSDTIDITLKANKAKDTYYQINDGEKKAYKADDVITIGGDTAYEEKTTITVTGISEDDGSELKKEITFQRGKEPTVSDGEFAIKVKKSDFDKAPTLFAYTNDKAETALTGKWPGDAFVEDDDADYYVYKNDKITDEARIIIVSGTWRSTPDMQPGLLAKGSMLYDKKSNELTEMPSGDPGKVTIKYVDQDGKELKSIYRVGVIGKKYKTYPAEIDGYTLVETPKNATGEFEADGEVVYVYAAGDSDTVKPTTAPGDNDDPKASANPDKTETPKNTEKPEKTETPDKTETPKKTEAPSKTETPDKTETPSKTEAPSKTETPDKTEAPSKTNSPETTATVKPTITPSAEPSNQPTGTPSSVHGGATQQPSATPSAAPSVSATPAASGQPATPTAQPDGKYQPPLIFTSVDEYYLDKNIRIEAAMLDKVPNCTYSFSVTDANGRVLVKKPYTEATSYEWKPSSIGTYYIGISVQDADGNVICTNQKQITVVQQDLSLRYFKAAKINSSKIKLTVKSNGGQGKVQYKFSVKAPGKKKSVIKNYSTKTTVQYTTKKKGTYYFYLEMKDGSGVRIAKAIKYKKTK